MSKKGEIFIEEISSDGKCLPKLLLEFKDPFYSTWKPLEIGKNTYITRFTTEFGNGWFTIKNSTILEFFYD